jgi:hypothetical protein
MRGATAAAPESRWEEVGEKLVRVDATRTNEELTEPATYRNISATAPVNSLDSFGSIPKTAFGVPAAA